MSSFGKHSRDAGFKSGDNWYTCPRCSFDIYASEARKEWTGLLVCPECWDTRNPQDLRRAPKEQIAPKLSRKEGISYITVNYIYGPNVSGGQTRAGVARAGKNRAAVGYISPDYAVPDTTFGGVSGL